MPRGQILCPFSDLISCLEEAVVRDCVVEVWLTLLCPSLSHLVGPPTLLASELYKLAAKGSKEKNIKREMKKYEQVKKTEPSRSL